MLGDQLMLEAALSRWSILVQMGIVSVLMVIFFAAWLTTRRKVLFSWMLAWSLDTVALAAVLSIAVFSSPFPGSWVFATYVGYSSAKVLFVMFLVLGLFQYRRVRLSMARRASGWLPLIALTWGAAALVVCRDTVQVQALTYGAVTLMLIGGGAASVRRGNSQGARIVGLTFLVHGLVFGHHLVVLAPTFWGLPIPAYMSRISFLDGVSEFLVGLGCIVAMGLRAVEELEEANQRTEASEKTLRGLVDSDPLTGLFNRRRLERFVESLPGAGIVLYLDVDRFKQINDSWGHAAGDACLLRVAESLRHVVRSYDGLFRIGGDEFLVIAPKMTVPDAKERVEQLRALLGKPDEQGISLSVSVGIAQFGETMEFDEAMAAADAEMYRDKGRRD